MVQHWWGCLVQLWFTVLSYVAHVCVSYCCAVIIFGDLVQLWLSCVAFVSVVSVDGSDLIKQCVQIRFSARFGLSVYVVQRWFSFGSALV